MSPLLTAAEVADMLGVSTTVVRRLTRTGELRGVDVAAGTGQRARWRYRAEDVAAFIAQRGAA